MLAHFTLNSVGTGDESKEVWAKALRIIKASDLPYQLTSMGFIFEGTWDEVMLLAKKCHEEAAKFTDRVVATITLDDHKGLKDRLKQSVLEVEYALGEGAETGGLT